MSNETQVLVVGAGPTGLATAIALTQKGIDVMIIDASPSNKYGARAAIVHSHTLEVLDPLGSASAIVERGIKCDAFHLKSTPDHSLVKVDLSLVAKYTNFPFSVLISQGDVEGILQANLGAKGIHVQRGKEITGIKRIHDDRAEVLFADDSTIVTKYIIGADGSHSTVRHLVGIDFKHPQTGLSYDDPNDPEAFQMALADVYLEEPLPDFLLTDQPNFLLERLILLIPLPSSDPNRLMWRLGLGVPPGVEGIPHDPSIEYLQRELNNRNIFGAPIIISSVLVSSRYRVRAALADTYTAKIGNTHVLLIGDAAHVHSPMGGQGMNLGICDAVSAANTIYTHMNTPTTDSEKRNSVLKAYATKRREAGERVVGLAMTLTKIVTYGAGSRWKVTLRNALFRTLMSIRTVRRMAAWRISGLVNRPDDII